MYICTLSSYNSRNTARGRIAAIPEKEQRPRHCIMSAHEIGVSFPALCVPSPSLLAHRCEDFKSAKSVTDDDGNNSCPIFPPARRTCPRACASLRNAYAAREVRRRTATAHRMICMRQNAPRNGERRDPVIGFTLDEVYAVAVVNSSGNYHPRKDAVIIRITSPYLILTVRRRLQFVAVQIDYFTYYEMRREKY